MLENNRQKTDKQVLFQKESFKKHSDITITFKNTGLQHNLTQQYVVYVKSRKE